MKLLNTSLSKVLALTAIILGGLVVNYLTIAWTGPTPGVTAPGANTDAPINAGSGSQTKTGDLTLDGNLVVNSAASVDGLTSYSDSNLFTNATGTQSFEIKPGYRGSVATADYTTLDIVGTVGTLFVDDQIEAGSHIKTQNTVAANRFCDENMENCFYPENTKSYNSSDIVVIDVGDKNEVNWFLTASKPAALKSRSTNNLVYCALGDVRRHLREETGTDTWNQSCRLSRSGGDWIFEARVTGFNREAIYCQYFCIPK